MCVCVCVCVPQVEFIYRVFTRMPGESYRRRIRSLLLCLCDSLERESNPFLGGSFHFTHLTRVSASFLDRIYVFNVCIFVIIAFLSL